MRRLKKDQGGNGKEQYENNVVPEVDEPGVVLLVYFPNLL